MSRSVKYLRYTLTLKAPAIVSTLSGDPNSSITQPFISGGAVRGVLAGELLNKGVSADSADFRRLILDGDVRFLHAYPAKGSVRSLPAPVPWKKVKALAGKSAHDLTAYTGQIDPGIEFGTDDDDGNLSVHPVETWPTTSLTRIEFSFLEFSGTNTGGLKVRTDARSHQQRDRVKGRSWKKTHEDGREDPQGALFAYEYLEPGQSFHGIIQILADSDNETADLIKKVKETLDLRTIFIGRSRRAGYGGEATIEFGLPEQREAPWKDVQENDVAAGSLFRVYLLSACIARDPCTGQLDPAALSELLKMRLGGEAVEIKRALWDFETIGGFNRKWQLEVPQALAVKAGSMLVLEANQAISAATFREIEHDGFGERRIEGFGRLVFLSAGSRTVSITTDDRKPDPHPQPGGPAPQLVEFLQQRLLNATFSRSLVHQVRAIIGDLKRIKPLTSSLIGRLRIPLRNGDPSIGLQTLRQWLEGDDSQDRRKLKREARDKLRACRFSNTTLFDWLKDNANTAAGTRSALNEVNKRANQLSGNAQLAEDAAKSQGAIYAVQLIDAVLATLARRARRTEKETAS